MWLIAIFHFQIEKEISAKANADITLLKTQLEMLKKRLEETNKSKAEGV